MLFHAERPAVSKTSAVQALPSRTADSIGARCSRTVACALLVLAVGGTGTQRALSQKPAPAGTPATSQEKVAQSATLTGHVADAAGTPVPDADITVEDLVSHKKLNAKSDSGGGFTIENIAAGEYSLSVAKPGFKRFIVNKVPLVGGDQARATVEMQPGSPGESVVGAPTSVVSRVGTALAGKDLNDIPENQRNFVNLVQLSSGANEADTNGANSNARPGAQHDSSSVSLGGQPPAANNAMIDGIDNIDRSNQSIALHPSIDLIKEVQISVSAYPANLGRGTGGVVNLVSKAGGEKFHGGLYEYFRNDVLDAFPFLFGAHPRKPELRQNQFGGSLGGPLVPNKLFFFGDYEGFRLIEGRPPVTLIVPTAYEHAHPGDFSDVGGPVIASPDPVGLQYFKLYPLPNQGSNSFVASPSGSNFAQTGDLRIDDHITPHDSFFARYSYDKAISTVPSAFPDVTEDGLTIHPGGQLYTDAGSVQSVAMNTALSYVHQFSRNVELDLLAGYTFVNNIDTDLNPNQPINQAFGQPGINVSATTQGLAPINVTAASSLGNSGDNRPLNQVQNLFQEQAALQWVRGPHAFTFGGRVLRRQFTENQNQYGLGLWTVSTLPNLVQGLFTAVQRSVSLNQPHYLLWESSGWFVDRWKATPHLTLTYGARYDVFPPVTEVKNQMSNFDPGTGAVILAGTPGVSNAANVRTDWTGIAPRFGFSWQALKRTTLHGGLGLVVAPAEDTAGQGDRSYPYISTFGICGSITNVCPGGYTTLAAGLPNPTVSSLTNLTGYLLHNRAFGLKNVYLEEFNLGFDETLSSKDVLHLNYRGSLGRHITQQFADLNAPPPNASTSPNTLRPYYAVDPNLTTVQYIESGGVSSYNSLQVAYAHSLAQGLTASFNYTLGHGIDNASDSFGGDGTANGYGAVIATSHLRDYGNSDLDVRHHINAFLSYAFPAGKGLHGVEGLLAKGWQINVLEVWGTGLPYTVVNATDLSGTHPGVSAADRSNVVGNPQLANSGVFSFFNTAAFATQTPGTLGNEARNQYFGPHVRHTDVSLFKMIPIHDKLTAQFRTECFNVTNTSSFGPPASTLNGANFGQLTQITAGYTPREIQFALRLNF